MNLVSSLSFWHLNSVALIFVRYTTLLHVICFLDLCTCVDETIEFDNELETLVLGVDCNCKSSLICPTH